MLLTSLRMPACVQGAALSCRSSSTVLEGMFMVYGNLNTVGFLVTH